MEQKKPNDYHRFFGRWKVNTLDEYITIEFNKGGTFNCYGDNTLLNLIVGMEEGNQILSLVNTAKFSPTWDLKDGKLAIMISNIEEFYDYNFYNNDTQLDLIKLSNRKKLSLIKDS